ncbi:MAG: potassium channel family protein [Merismopediaceae bacterium]|nr:potassium channel family protein [Merismopediaceae bacterium]
MSKRWQTILEHRWRAFYRNPYQHLFLSLLVIFVGFATIDDHGSLGAITLGALFLFTVLFVIETFNLRRSQLHLLRAIAILSFILSSYIIWIEDESLWGIALVNRLVQFTFLVSSIVIILKGIFQAKQVTGDTVTGGICVYLMLGLAWFELYEILLLFEPAAFSREMPFYRTFYFSFVTLTTVGYGDVVPVHRVAMILSNLEAVIGQIYLAVIVARLVSLYAQEKKDDPQEPLNKQ